MATVDTHTDRLPTTRPTPLEREEERSAEGTATRLNCLVIDGHGLPDMTRRVAREAVFAAASVQVLVGLAGGILGLLALLGIYPMVLALVAMLSLGASVLLSGAAISGKVLGILRR
jgi:hypothetical protein